jgi:hypothetical protein
MHPRVLQRMTHCRGLGALDEIPAAEFRAHMKAVVEQSTSPAKVADFSLSRGSIWQQR